MSKLDSHSPFDIWNTIYDQKKKLQDIQLKNANLAIEIFSMESMCMNMNL
jgi:uncharacterized protein YvpB